MGYALLHESPEKPPNVFGYEIVEGPYMPAACPSALRLLAMILVSQEANQYHNDRLHSNASHAHDIVPRRAKTSTAALLQKP